MDPSSRVELPPRGADLSFLNGGGAGTADHDTPSRWLTFGGTPNGSTTPGTAFGSPFWASLSQSKASPNAKGYSPSKELNPFELSFFPKADTLAGGNSGVVHDNPRGGQDVTAQGLAIKQEEDDSLPEANLLKQSLKRPFREADSAAVADNNSSGTFHDNHQNNSSNAHAQPSWKRPKYNAYYDSSASSSEAAMNGSSPAMGGPSPDDGSPASSIVPTPNIQNAVLPAHRKDSLPPDQLEAAKLGRAPADVHVPSPSVFGPPGSARGMHLPSAPASAIAQSIPQAMPTVLQTLPPGPANQQHAPYPYTQYLPHGQHGHQGMQHQMHNNGPPAPIILPPKTVAQVQQQQQQQMQHSPVTQQQQQQPPLSATAASGQHQQNLNTIPYANGRAPSSQPTTSVRSKAIKTKVKAAGKETEEEKEKAEEVGNMSSTSSSTKSAPASSSKKGKKASEEKKQIKIVEPEPEPEPEPDLETESYPDGPLDDDEEEKKRKAFLERNRQAACRSRQKKKEWIGNLETHAAHLQAQNQSLTAEIDNLRKEMFALRHTLSFHERCGCPSINDWAAREGLAGGPPPRHPGHPYSHPHAYPSMAPPGPGPHNMAPQHQPPPPPGMMQQAAPRPLQQPSSLPHQQMAPPPLQAQAPPAVVVAPPRSAANSASPPNYAPPPQTYRPPVSLAPPAVSGAPGQTRIPSPDNSARSMQQPPTNINLSAASLRPQPSAFAVPLSQQSAGNDIQRPGSAGARFGVATPNFSDLFGGAMGKFPGLTTPGGVSMSPMLPNTFGLSMQDIPVRPASAPPTPSPALDFRSLGNGDYFSAKNPSHSTPGFFGDLLASLNQPMQSSQHTLMT